MSFVSSMTVNNWQVPKCTPCGPFFLLILPRTEDDALQVSVCSSLSLYFTNYVLTSYWYLVQWCFFFTDSAIDVDLVIPGAIDIDLSMLMFNGSSLKQRELWLQINISFHSEFFSLKLLYLPWTFFFFLSSFLS